MKSKAETYIGFAVKKGSVVYGLDCISVYRKKVRLILYSADLSENSFSRLKKEAERFNCPLAVFPDTDVLKNKNCKALAICDKSLAEAIQNNL